MEKNNCIRRPREYNNTEVISFRITPHMANWMKEENLSPRAILIEGCKELGYKPTEEK